jgi:ComF family protein
MFKSLINLFYPRVCSGCNSFLLTDEIVICTVCRHEIPLSNFHNNPNNEAFAKFYGKVPIEFVAALFYFHKKGIVQEMIHKLKYKGHEEIGEAIGFWYAEELKNVKEIHEIDCIIPVPLHSRKLKERGYNQVTSFGKALSESLSIPYNDSVLVRTVYSKTQTKKNLLGRTELVSTLFDVHFDATMHGKHFLLIDDIITTGSTLEACSRALLKIPNAKVSIVCMAMSHM